ncbi:OmpA family protein [Arenimonas fontis]|uniref:OmpA family protein n=1 Tax=Arenimonas fontis TaxID=2608255 RepID=A0A5B2Z991_9GAMM|nr:OmpA family protein [Arenimonas fontis]KAA2284083.1 OmpA family protein [Arenimonas fontis]
MTPSHRLACLAVVISLAAPAAAQDIGRSLKRTAERAVQSEVERAVDREVRRVTRCALGDERCAYEAERRGEDVEYVDSRGRVVQQAPAGSRGQAASGPAFRVLPYAGSNVREEKVLAFDAYPFVVGRESNGDLRTRTVEGRVTKTVYDNPSGRSTLEILRNYEQALLAQGLARVYSCNGRRECGSKWKEVADINVGVAGDIRYLAAEGRVGASAISVAVMVNPQRSWVYVVEAEAMQTGQAGVSADELAAELAASGAVRLDGIYFDTGKATLKPESGDSLAQVAELMRRDPSLRLEIVGHTDDVGDAAANQRLSEERALAVRSALVIEHRVPDRRLRSRGAGESEPVAPNSSEAGRALNRRVELVKQ